MENYKNHYEILEVSQNASAQVISAAYRALTAKYHPDKNPELNNNSDRMAAINVAFGVLSDPIRRKLYDEEIGLCEKLNSKPDGESPNTPSKSNESLASSSDRNYSSNTGLLVVGAILVLIFLLIKISTSPDGDEKTNHAADRYMSWFFTEKKIVGDSGFSRDYEGAMNGYKEISNSNLYTDGRAEFRISEMYLYGLGVEIDYKEAFKWLLVATNRFDCTPLPYFFLGYFYEFAIGVERNPVLAYRNYLQAASKASIPSNDHYNLMAVNTLEKDRFYIAITERLKYSSVQDAAKKMADKIEIKLSKEEIREAQRAGK